MIKKKLTPEEQAQKIRDEMDPWIREHADALDYPDAGSLHRKTGVHLPERLKKLIAERKAKRGS